MNTHEINNHFGDMDLFLMDAILKGKIPENGRVLDLGCGEGRNGIYFIRQGYDYVGIDADESRLRLIEYMAKSLANSNASFEVGDIRDFKSTGRYDLIICSRVLHFAISGRDFMEMWNVITEHLAPSGVVYISMDSAVENTLARPVGDDRYEFPDGKIRLALTEKSYHEMKKGFEEIEPLKTLVHHTKRAQSFMLLQKS